MKKTFKSLTALLIAILVATILTGCDMSTTETANQEKFTLVEVSNAYYDGYVAYYIEGTIKNNTEKSYSYVQVTFNLYDKDGVQLGTALANINNLEANGTWKFKAIGTGEGSQVASYKLVEITGW